jgi:CRP/FNR family transcriptional regulator, polysaccharide utilization system transcription regulator
LTYQPLYAMQYPDKFIESVLERKNSLFFPLSQKEKETIIHHYSVARVKKGAALFKSGEKSRGVICLVSGKAKVYRLGIAGREHIIRLIRPGDQIGFQNILNESHWTASSLALEDVDIITIEKQTIIRILKTNADLAFNIGGIISQELAESYDKMVSLTQKHVRGRLAESILMIGEIYGYEADGKTLSAHLSRNDIAHLSNMTTSNAIRTLSSFSNEGLIKIKSKNISILDFPGLSRISDQA